MAGERPMLDFFSVTGGIFDISIELTPPSLRATSPIFCCAKTPRNTTGHGREEGESNPLFIAVKCTYIALRQLVRLRDTAREECDIRFVAVAVF